MNRSLYIFLCFLCLEISCTSGETDGASPISESDASGETGTDASFGNPEPVSDGSNRDAIVFIDASIDEDGGCGESPFEATRRKVNVLLVIDKSGSMNDTPDGFGTDKWSALKSALKTTLEAAQNDISFGLDLFPYPDGCTTPTGSKMRVAIGEGRNTVTAILDMLNNTEPSGGTPTSAALKRAFHYFTEGHGSQLQGDNYVVLATDGGPNCNSDTEPCDADSCTTNMDGDCPEAVPNCCVGEGGQEYCLDDDATRKQIEALKQAGISTFVIGIPGSESYADALDSFADEGGQVNPAAPPSYFAVSAEGGELGSLKTVLSSITKELITSCRLQLASRPPDEGLLNLIVEENKIPKQGEDGWTLDRSTDPPTIEIQGKTCDRIEQKGVESVRIVYGCPTIEVG